MKQYDTLPTGEMVDFYLEVFISSLSITLGNRLGDT